MADTATGTAGIIRINVSESGQNAAANTSVVNYAFYLIENTVNNSTFANGIGARVEWYGVTVLWSGTFNFDWRGGGNQTTLIASGSFTVGHNPDGSAYVNVAGFINSTGTSGAGGPANVLQGITLTTLKVIPALPTAFTATRVSDTQINLAWTQANASNGEPTVNVIEVSRNNAAYTSLVSLGNVRSASVAAVANQKLQYRITSGNAAGGTGWATSTIAYTTPAAPTNTLAAKNASLDIDVSWTPNVGYAEHTHEVWHGTVLAGVTTWDGAALATVPSGTSTYTHAAPDPSKVHVYEVRAVAGALQSAFAVTNSVQLLIAPNAPTVPGMPAVVDKASAVTFAWTHNPADTTPQTAYEFSYSTNGGGAWTTTGKVVSTANSRAIAANTYAANVALTTRVRTWGSATTGGSDGTGASPWSATRTVTYKTVPTATVTAPANGGTINDATIRATVGFAQPEGATFVKASLELWQGGALIETLDSNIQVGITFATQAQNGLSYTVKAKVQDSNGLWSAQAQSTFSVVYLAPVPATPDLVYLPDSGYGQLTLSIPAPGAGQSAATTVTIVRSINGVAETLVQDYPVSDTIMTFLDTTPTIHGTNSYTITTKSALGAQSTTTDELVTTECRRAYLSKGQGFGVVTVFGGNLSVSEDLNVASDTIQAAGRTKPIGLYGMETSVKLKVQSFIFKGFGSTIDELRSILLLPGKACYRDASGRRVFGSVKGSVAYKKTDRGDLSFTIEETD